MSSITVRRSLGRQLRTLRDNARKKVADVTAAGICSKAKLARIESGTIPVKMVDVRGLCWLYGVDQATTDFLAEMALNTASDAWWEDYSDVMPSWFGMYVELEAAADRVEVYDAEAVFGVLQTSAYRQALLASEPGLTAEESARHLRVHQERQRAALERTRPLRITAILGAGVLSRQVGSAEVMAEQTEHLLRCAREPHIDILILPWAAGAHQAMKGPIQILGFEAADDPDVVYLETYTGARYVEATGTVQNCHVMFTVIRNMSIPIEEHLR